MWKSIKTAARSLAIPHWFIEWVEIEQKADALKHWQPLVVPGLLQTPGYARAVLSRQPGVTADQIEEQVTQRLERQELLTRAEPLLLWVMLDEGVLYRPIGDARVMREQLARLVEMSGRNNVTVQVLPQDAGGSCGLAGAFVVASIPGESDAVYFESDGRGHVTDRSEEVASAGNRYTAISADALPSRASIELISRVIEERWTRT